MTPATLKVTPVVFLGFLFHVCLIISLQWEYPTLKFHIKGRKENYHAFILREPQAYMLQSRYINLEYFSFVII